MNAERPKIKLQTSPIDRILEILAAGLLLFSLFVLIFNFSALPPEIPTHFNAGGEVDAVGNKGMIIALPAINVIAFALVAWAQRVPHLHNYPVSITAVNVTAQYQNSVKMLRVVNVLTTSSLAYVTYATIETALGRMNGLSVWFVPVLIATLLATIIFYVSRSYRLK